MRVTTELRRALRGCQGELDSDHGNLDGWERAELEGQVQAYEHALALIENASKAFRKQANNRERQEIRQQLRAVPEYHEDRESRDWYHNSEGNAQGLRSARHLFNRFF